MIGVLGLISPTIVLLSFGFASYGLILNDWLMMLLAPLFSFMKFDFLGY
jgi:hypothetical protein